MNEERLRKVKLIDLESTVSSGVEVEVSYSLKEGVTMREKISFLLEKQQVHC